MPRCDRWALRIQQLPTATASMSDAASLHFRPRPNVKEACRRAYGWSTVTMAQEMVNLAVEYRETIRILLG